MIAELWRAERRERTLLTSVAVVWAFVMIVILARLAALDPGKRTLFPIYRDAGINWVEGRDQYPENLTGDPFGLFRYSPIVATMFSPFAVIPQKIGDSIWRLINAGLLLGGVVAIARAFQGPTLDRRWLAILLALMIPPGLGHLSNGQCNALVIGLILIGYAAASEGRFNWAAACLAVATLFKLYPIAAAGLLMIVYPRRFGPRYAIALAVGIAAPFLFQQTDYVARQYQLWIQYTLREDRSTWELAATNVDFQMLLRISGLTIGLTAYRIVELAVGLGFAFACLASIRARHPIQTTLVLALGLAGVWMTVFGPATESPTYLVVAPSVAWSLLVAWKSPADTPLDRFVRILTTLSYGLFVSLQLMGVSGELFYAYRQMCPQPIAGLVFLAALMLSTFGCERLAMAVSTSR